MAKNVDVVEEVTEDQLTTAEGAEVEVVKKEGFGTKVWNFTKRNCKKIAVGAICVGAGFVGYAFGKKSNNSTGLELIDLDDATGCDDAEVADILADMADSDNE